MSAAKYDECMKLLRKAGAGNPPGRSYHASFGPNDQLMVFDVWALGNASSADCAPVGSALACQVGPAAAGYYRVPEVRRTALLLIAFPVESVSSNGRSNASGT